MEPNLYDQYQDFCGTTAVYPEEIAAPYLALGIASEIAESQEHLILYGRIDKHEIGDAQWYVSRLCSLFNLSFRALVEEAKARLFRSKSAENTGGMSLLLASIEAGLIAGKVKKQLRDGHSWTGEKREDVRQYIRDRLVEIVVTSIEVLGPIEYDRALERNMDKLSDRKQRGALQGDGSNR